MRSSEKIVQGTFNMNEFLHGYIQVSFRSLDAEMSEKLLDVTYVNALLQQMCSKAVPQTVKTESLMVAGFCTGIDEHLLRTANAVWNSCMYPHK